MKERNLNLDLIRVVAILSVVCVHFIRNIGFYDVKIDNIPLIIALFLRTFLMICVPLFILLTGYLMNKKTLSKDYYKGIIRVLFVFIFYKIIFFIFDIFCFKNVNSFTSALKSFFSFENDYSWYVNMYIGLFLIIPFINLIYNNLTSKKEKQLLILTLFFLTSVSTLNVKITVIPNWWCNIYPLTYYFIGAYISEYGFNLKKSHSIIILLASWLISSSVFTVFSYGRTFAAHNLTNYNGVLNLILSVLVFGLLLNLNTSKLNSSIKNIILNISKLSFGMYLFSYIVDEIIYKNFNNLILNIEQRLLFFPIISIIVVVLSLILSFICNFVYEKFMKPKVFKNS